MKLLVLFSVCLALLATAPAAASSTSKGNKPSAAIDETAEMLCNVLVQASKELIHDGSVKVNLLKDYLRQDCSKLPKTLNLVQKCQAAVDTYVTDIVEHLQMGTETDKICPLIQGREKPSLTLPLPKSLNITPNQTCVLCEFVLHLLQTFATANSSAQELASILERICQIMPDVLRTECKGFIEAYGIDIIAILVREFDPPTVCEKIKLCPKQQNVQFLSKPNPNTCGLCDYVETYLSSGFPKEKTCQYFSNDNNVKQNCEVLVQLYKPGYCPQLQICHEAPVVPPTDLSVQSVECSLCKYIVGYVENIIQNNKSAAAVEAALEKVCSIVPGALKDKCDKFVNTYGPIIALLLAKYNDTTQVCNALKVCNNGTEFSLPSLPHFDLPTVQSVECSLCKYIVGYVENIIQNNKSAAAVEAALEKVCSIVPGALKDKCDKFVNTYGPIIALLLAKYNDTTQVCNALKVCNNGTEFSLPSLPHFDLPSVQSVECSLCKYIVGYVENIIQNNKSAAAVEAALEKVCSIVPGALKDKCDKFVNTYGPIIALLLTKYNDTTQVCNALKVCNNGTEIPLSRMSRFDLPKVNSVECSLCKYIVGYVENIIQNNKSAAAVEAALEKVCSIVPGALKDKCDKFVNTYGPIIALLLAKYNDTTQVCNALKVCNNGTELSLPDFAPFDLPSVKSVECSLCKYVVGYVENVIQNNKSAAAIEAALEKVCSIIPGTLKDKCDKFVNTYGPIIALLLAKYNDTTQVCNALKVCNNGTDLALPHFDLANVKSAECALCKYIVSYADSVIQNNKSEAAIDAALEKVCTILPAPLKDKCKTFVDTYGPILAQLLVKYATPEQVCDALKICNNGTVVLQPVTENLSTRRRVQKRSVAPLLGVGASPECALCKFIVSYVDSVIQNNKSQAAIDAALEKVCTILPAALKAKCKTFVDTYGPILAQLLVKYTTPDQVCDALKLCNNGTQVVMPKIEVPSVKSAECALCKYIVSYVDSVIQNNKSQAAIDAALEKVCTILPAALKDKCKTFVDTYGPILAQLLVKYTTPEQVCDALKLCNNGTVSISPIAAPTVEGVECSLCKYVVGYIEHVVESNKTEAAVDAALEKVCTILPSDLKDKCKTFVDTYGPLLFQLVQKFGTADAVCKALKLCLKETQPTSAALVFPTIDASAIKSAECALCKYIVSYVDSVIQNNKSQAAIDAALEKVCTILPAALKDKCKTFVDTYGPILAQLLVKYTTPEQVCDALKLCNNGTVVLQPVTENITARKVQKRSVAPLQAVGASPECALCKYVVSYVDSVIQNNKSEAAIDAALEKVCTILPAPLKDKCKTFVDTYGPILAQLLVKYATPDQVCNAMKLCNNGTVVLQPVIENISSPQKVQQQPIAPFLAVSASPECALCKYVISYLDSVIQNNKSEAAIEAALDQVCKILPAPLQDKCKQFVTIYGPVIPQLLIHYGTPDQVCNALSLCNNGTQKAAVRSPRAIVQSLKKSVGNDVECSLCKYVLNYINVLVSSNASAQEIEKALELVCGILPSADHKKCDTFVQQYGPVLAQLVAELDDPNVVCQWLSLCTKSTGQFIEIPVVKKGVKTLPCNLCQYVVNYLDVVIKANSTETDFEKALDQVCDILPGKGLQGECQTLVNLFGPAMINFLVEHADPKTVCQTLGICDK